MTSPGGRRGVLAAVAARPNCSSICGSPGSLSWSRISSLVSGFSSGWVYRLANTHALAACSSSALQRLPGAQPVGAAVAGRQQDRGRRRRRSAARQQAQVPAEVEIALRQPSWLCL